MAQEESPVTHEIAEAALDAMGLNSEMAAAIGRVAASWTALETSTMILLDGMVGIPANVLAIMISETSFIHKMSIVTSLIHHSRNPDWFNKWEVIEKKIEVLRNKRNDIIHGHWGKMDDGSVMTIRLKSKRKFAPELTLRPIDGVKQVTADILLTLVEFNDFTSEIFAADIQGVLKNPQGPALDRTQSPNARAQNQARAQKKAKRQAPQGPKLSSAQKRTLREAQKQSEGPSS